MPTVAAENTNLLRELAALSTVQGGKFYIMLVFHRPTVATFKIILKLLTSTFHQNTVHGQSTLKQVFRQMQSMLRLLKLQRKERLKPVNRGGRNAPCKVLAWVRNGCLAIAQGSRGKRPMIYSGHTGHPYRAEAEALKQCRAAGEPECKIIAPEGCSLPYL